MTRLSNNLTLAFSCIAHAYAHLFILLYATVVLVLQNKWDMSYADLQWLYVPGFVMFGVAALPAGWLADRWSAAGMIAIMLFGLGATSIMTGLADSPVGLITGLTGIGVFAAIYHPVGIPWLIKNAANPSRALGLNGVFGSVGTAMAAIVAGSLAEYWSWRAAFIIPGAISLLSGAVFVYAMRRGYIVEAESDQKPQPQTSRGDMRRAFAVLALTAVCTGMIFQSTSVGLPKIFEERLGGWLTSDGGELNAFAIGGFVTLAYFSAAAAQVIGGELASRYSLKWVYLLSQFVQVPTLLIAWMLHSPLLILVAAFMVSFNVLGQPAENMLLARYTPQAWRARVFGAKFVLTLGVSAIGVSLIPILHSATGTLDALLLVLMALAALAGMVALMLPSERSLKAAAAAPEPAE
jgi:MFS family permease